MIWTCCYDVNRDPKSFYRCNLEVEHIFTITIITLRNTAESDPYCIENVLPGLRGFHTRDP